MCLISKSNLHYTRGNTSERVTSGEVHLRGLAPGQHSSEEVSQQWQVGDCVRFDRPETEPQTTRTRAMRLTTQLNGRSDTNTVIVFIMI